LAKLFFSHYRWYLLIFCALVLLVLLIIGYYVCDIRRLIRKNFKYGKDQRSPLKNGLNGNGKAEYQVSTAKYRFKNLF
jgi:hypothetical protein